MAESLSYEQAMAELEESYADTPLRERTSLADITVDIFNEVVRSYGFKYGEDGFEWSAGNIVEAFRERPIWSTIDYLTVAVPVGKLGVAAARITGVAKGGSIAREAYQSGQLGFKAARRVYEDLPRARTRTGRLFESPFKRIDVDLFAQHRAGLTGDEISVLERGIQRQAAHESEILGRAFRRQAEDVIQSFRGIDPDRAREIRMLGEYGRETPEFQRRLAQLERGRETTAATKLLEFRDKVHTDLGAIFGWSASRMAKDKIDYMPHVYENFIEGVFGMRPSELRRNIELGVLRGDRRRGAERLMARQIEGTGEEWLSNVRRYNEGVPEDMKLTPILDPQTAVGELLNASSIITHHKYLNAMLKTPLMKQVDDIGPHEFNRLVREEGWVKLGSLIPRRQVTKEITKAVQKDPLVKAAAKELQRARQMKADPEVIGAAREAFENAKRVAQESMDVSKHPRVKAAMKDLRKAEKAGDPAEIEAALQAVQQAKHSVQRTGPWKHVPYQYMEGVIVDPYVAQEMRAAFEIVGELGHNPIYETFFALNQMFKLNKTVRNPATQMRNFLSNVVFHSFATGTMARTPHQGAEMLLRAARGDETAMAAVQRATDIGVLGYTADREAIEDMARFMGAMPKAESASLAWLDKMPVVGTPIKKADQITKRLYAAGDDVWKFDAFLRNEKKLLANGLDAETATARAAHEVVKYFPMYSDTNEFTKIARQWLPFTSFTTESIRVFKNAMTWKPWSMMAWAHSGEAITELTQAWMGVSNEELEMAQEALAPWTKGKKRFLLPWRDTASGALQFFDLSYTLPLADMAGEAEKMEGALFGIPPEINPLALMGVTSNPLIGMAVATTMSKDPFTGREIQPETTERIAGTYAPSFRIPEGVPRKVAGLAEHLARTLAPPWMAPGFAGTNLWELVRGDVDPRSGLPREPDVAKTIAANLLGLRTLTPSEAGARGRVYEQRRVEAGEKSRAWARFEHALENDLTERAQLEKENLIRLLGGRKQFREAWEARTKRKRRGGLSKQQEREARQAAERAGGLMLDPHRGRRLRRLERQLR